MYLVHKPWALVIGIVGILGTIGYSVHRAQALKRFERVSGTITEVTAKNSRCQKPGSVAGSPQGIKHDCTLFEATIEFTTKSDQKMKMTMSAGSRRDHNRPIELAEYKRGQQVMISYDPLDPSDHMLDEFSSRWAVSLIVGTLSLVLLIIGFVPSTRNRF